MAKNFMPLLKMSYIPQSVHWSMMSQHGKKCVTMTLSQV